MSQRAVGHALAGRDGCASWRPARIARYAYLWLRELTMRPGWHPAFVGRVMMAAAVTNGGGLGLLGGGNGDLDWLARELPIVAVGTGNLGDVCFQSGAIDVATVERALEQNPRAVMLSFGDPRPFVGPIRQAGAALILQATDLEEARQAVDLGADVIVAQGTESGGHGAQRGRSTLPFVPIVVDLAAPTPVLAAGGIADGRGLAAALALGAAGALIGTRFQASAEALVD